MEEQSQGGDNEAIVPLGIIITSHPFSRLFERVPIPFDFLCILLFAKGHLLKRGLFNLNNVTSISTSAHIPEQTGSKIIFLHIFSGNFMHNCVGIPEKKNPRNTFILTFLSKTEQVSIHRVNPLRSCLSNLL